MGPDGIVDAGPIRQMPSGNPMTTDSVLAELPEGRRTWGIASVFGDAGRLAAVHDQLRHRIRTTDNLVYLGNFLGRGNVLATVNEMLIFRRALLATRLDDDCGAIAFLRGSQEEMWHKLLQVQFAPNPRQVLEWMLTQGVGATLEAYGGSITEGLAAANGGAVVLSRWTNHLRSVIRDLDGHERLMSALRRAAHTRDGTVLFVNAGIDPSRPLSAQTDSFWWGHRDFEALSQPYDGFHRVVRGYDPHRRGIVVTETTASIDAGCGFGGPLVAACFDANGSLLDTIEA